MQFYGRFACFRFPSRLFTDVNRRSHCLNRESLEVHQIQRHLVRGGGSHKSLPPSSKVTFSSLFAGLKTWIGTSKVLWSDSEGNVGRCCSLGMPGTQIQSEQRVTREMDIHKAQPVGLTEVLRKLIVWRLLWNRAEGKKGGKKEPLSRSFF